MKEENKSFLRLVSNIVSDPDLDRPHEAALASAYASFRLRELAKKFRNGKRLSARDRELAADILSLIATEEEETE